MCGIAGIFHYGAQDRPIDRALLERMTARIAHRGPDGEGFFVDGPAGLGHRRLTIVDLTETGSQPMSNHDGSLWTSYNGEFYNHATFRAALAERHTFRGTSDTETFLYLFEERGPACFAEIAAIFAVALWDARRRVLTLARDPLGVKQLYYHDDGERIVFASEIKALLVCPGVPREIDEEGINQYLHFHTPLFDRTCFRGIKQVRPGEHIEVSERGLSRRIYFRVDDFTHEARSEEDEIASLRARLEEVVRDQLMADVPVGAFFSGGIDSSAVAAFAARAGSRPPCFGIHFAGQGVIDEREYQEMAARALGVTVELLTLDGATFPDDLVRCMYYQDEPVIGPAMLPMFHISRLAASRVKVCMGGQGGDEIFGGYARYALADPLQVAGRWFAGRSGRPAAPEAPTGEEPRPVVHGNLMRQLMDPVVLRRLLKGLAHLGDWRARYFEIVAKVPERLWRSVIAAPELVSRDAARTLFHEEMERSPAKDPADKVMDWDRRGYLPGLFHQDDRMSMAHSLESRVPLADPRLARFAARVDPALKIRSGATKWILRRAVADVLPEPILNRRKVGFDTPAEAWMRDQHAGFIRDLLLSTRARQRGVWSPRGIAALLDRPGQHLWFDVAWKVLAIETWAQVFLDAPPVHDGASGRLTAPYAPSPADDSPRIPELSLDGRAVPLATAPKPAPSRATALRDAAQEIRELGATGTAFRVRWELGVRTGAVALRERPPAPGPAPALLMESLPFGDPAAVAAAVRARIPEDRLARLRRLAHEAGRGRILCFSRWIADYSDPNSIDWQLNPVSGRRWNAHRHWSRALSEEKRVGDVKLTWEVARFSHAYHMARAAAFFPEDRAEHAAALAAQIRSFIADNPRARGVHWASGQEIAFRAAAWLFALAALGEDPAATEARGDAAPALAEAAAHIECHIDYARNAVYNNHLTSEAFGLLLLATVLPDAPGAARRRALGEALLDEQAAVQIYADGGYIQQSHTYQRVAMHVYLLATALLRRQAREAPRPWTEAMERSLDFLYAQQNPGDGRLPNFGSNDGSMPIVLTTCDYTDFRPLLQALSIATRGERLYAPGPWDEAAAWLFGPASLDAPLHPRGRASISFSDTGYHVLRGADPSSFSVLRCGTLKHRFSQIDMLSLDVWWRGENVVVDPGSYLYNGPARLHEHFVGTAGHSTVQIDGRDQMLHYRRFKNLYRTRATRLAFEDHPAFALVAGEHHGYARHPGGCVHRRAVLFVKDDLWVVVDRVTGAADRLGSASAGAADRLGSASAGAGEHEARLHWLCGDYPFHYAPDAGALSLDTPAGPFHLTVLDEGGAPLPGDVVRGGQDPPRGWLSRYYGEKVAVPSLAVIRRAPTPLTFLSVLSAARPTIHFARGRVAITVEAASVATASFRLADGMIEDIRIGPSP